MKIYTYYENIDFEEQDKLIELWQTSWSRGGFEPVVLGIEHAKKHPHYETFCENMKFIFNMVTGHQLSQYGLSCFVRWLAYATQNKSFYTHAPQDDEYFYVSDYDVINTGKWTIAQPVSTKLHLMDSACPCLASGTSSQFAALCYSFYDVTISRYENIKHHDHYHDQEFFQYNFIKTFNDDYDKLCKKYNIQLTRKRDHDVSPYDPSIIQHARAYHISHQNTNQIISQQPDRYHNMTVDQARIEIVKQLIN